MSGLWWIDSKELDAKQQAVLRLPPDGKYVVTGPPGSGKTNLLLLRAKLLIALGKQNFQVIGFNQTLVRFLRSSGALPEDKITTAMDWANRQLWELEGRSIDVRDFDEKRRQVFAAITAHLERETKSGLVDTLLVDEAQDYSSEEIQLFTTIANHVFLVGDSRQKIYKSATDDVGWISATNSCQREILTEHYRIGRKICEFADRLAKPAKGHLPILSGCRYNEQAKPSTVHREQLSSALQFNKIAQVCGHQMDAYPGEYIGVLCAKKETLANVAAVLTKKFGDRVTVQRQREYVDFAVNRPIVVTTMHGGKGLEFRCVHVPMCEELKRFPQSRELIYTAATRAKTSLHVYHEAPLSPFLEDAITAGESPPAAVDTDSLFEGFGE